MNNRIICLICILVLALGAIMPVGMAEAAGTRTLVLPADLRRVEEEAFQGDVSIASVVIPAGVEEICADAFADCASLELIAIDAGAKVTLDPRAFAGCGLTRLVVGTGAEVTMLDDVFTGCVAPFEIIASQDANIYFSEDALSGCGEITFTAHQGSDVELYAICHGYKTVSLGDESVLEQTRALVAAYGVEPSLLLSGSMDTNRLIVITNDDRLPDISGYEPVAIVRNGPKEYYIQFDNEINTYLCQEYLHDMDLPVVDIDRMQRCELVEYDDEEEELEEEISAAGVTALRWWGTSDAMGFDTYAPYVAEHQSGSQTIAILDVGVVLKKAGYDSRILMDKGVNYVPDARADQWYEEIVPGHGTKIIKKSHGSIIAAIIDDCAGDANVNLMIQRVSQTGQYVLDSSLEQAIRYAAQNGADIINISLYLPEYSEAVENAIKEATEARVKVIAAAGNAGENETHGPNVEDVFPACLPKVIAVSGIKNGFIFDERAGRGNKVAYGAPCRYIMDTYRKSPDAETDTSYAAPQIAAAMALVALDTTHSQRDLDACCLPIAGAGNGMPQLNLLTNTPATDIIISPDTPSQMLVGQEHELTWTTVPDDDNEGVRVTPSNESVLQVIQGEDGTCTLKALARGTATVTVTAVSGVSDSVDIQVIQPVERVEISAPEDTLPLGQSMQIVTLNVLPQEANDRALTWQSSEESVIAVSEEGIATAVGLGTANITAIAHDGYGAVSAPLTLTVVEAPEPNPEDQAYVTIRTKADGTLEVTGLEDGAPSDLTIPAEINGVAVTSIAESAFVSKGLNLTRVVIPGSVKTIGDYAFSGCENLKVVRLSEGLETIGQSAFMNCFALMDLVIPNGVTSIGEEAFSCCKSLLRVVIPGSVTSIPLECFIACSALAHVEIGEGVVTLDENAFYNCPVLHRIDIPASVRTIGRYAFGMCVSLEDVGFPEGLAQIDDFAFRNTGLITVTLPESLHKIGESVFAGCHELTRINLPTGLWEIGDRVFAACDKLAEITVLRGSYAHTWARQNGLPIKVIEPEGGETPSDAALFLTAAREDGTLEITGLSAAGGCPTELVIPGQIDGMEVTAISGYAFMNTQVLESVFIPDSVTELGRRAFYNCHNLRSVRVPQGVTTLPYEVFSRCDNLTQVNLPEGLTTIGPYAFGFCNSLAEISFPETLTRIDYYAFTHCALTQLDFPETLSYIGDGAFQHNTLTEVVVSEGVKVNNFAFANCKSLTAAQMPIGQKAYRVFQGCDQLETLTLSSGDATIISSSCYAGLPALRTVTIMPGVGRICEMAFQDCSSLDTVNLPEGLTRMDANVFENCASLTHINLPQSLSAIDDSVFIGCESLTRITVVRNSYGHQWALERGYMVDVLDGEVEMPVEPSVLTWTTKADGTVEITGFSNAEEYPARLILPDQIEGAQVSSIGEYAFENCAKLTSVVLPERLDTIGKYAFHQCLGLTKVDLPESLRVIGGFCFYGCRYLAELVLPDELNQIGNKYAISYVGTVYAKEGTNAARAVSAVDRCFRDPKNDYDLKYLFVDGNIAGLELGRVDTNLTEFTFPEGVTRIDYEAFKGSSVTSLIIPDTIDFIDGRAFVSSSLESIRLPAKLSKSMVELFADCENLREVILPEDMMAIGNTMFMNCKSLKSIDLPESIATIGASAFENSGLTSIVIPDYVYSIDTKAFYNLEIEEITLPEGILTINAKAFGGSLRRINLPESLYDIADDALANCPNLTAVEVVEDSYAYSWAMERNLPVVLLPSIDKPVPPQADPALFNYETLDDGTLEITGLKDPETCPYRLRLPGEVDGVPVTSIGESVFFRNNRLRQVVIPEGVTTIRTDAFYECRNLMDVDLPSTLISIAWKSFSGIGPCYMVFPEGFTQIEDCAFTNSVIRGVDLPESLTSIGWYAFSEIRGMTRIDIPDGVSVIEAGAFDHCYMLREVHLPNALTEINAATFRYCPALSEITIPRNVTSIGNSAFWKCLGLTRVNLPAALTSISDTAFDECTKLTTIGAPSGSFAETWAIEKGYTVVVTEE